MTPLTPALGADRQPAPDISVVVPTFDRADVLALCLAHLSQQTLPADRFEVIVVVDGSSDHTAAVLAAAPSQLRLSALRQPNLGPAAARNRGLERACGRLVLFLNDDALLARDALAIHLDEHTRRGPRDAVLGAFPMHPAFTPVDRPIGWCMNHTTLAFDYPVMTPGTRYGSGHFYTCNISVAREVVFQLGGFDEGFVRMGAEDIEFGVRFQELGGHVFYRPDCVARHAHRLDSHGLARMFEFRGRGGVHLFAVQPRLAAPHYAAMFPAHIEAFAQASERLAPMLERLHVALARVDTLPCVASGQAIDVKVDPAAQFDGHALWRCTENQLRRLVDALARRIEQHVEHASSETAPALEHAAACVYPALQFLKWYHDTVGVMSSAELRPLLARFARFRSADTTMPDTSMPMTTSVTPSNPVTHLRIDLRRMLEARSLTARVACLNESAGRRLSSSETAEAWLEAVKAVAAEGGTTWLNTLIGEFLRLAPYHPKTDGLYALWRGDGSEPLPASAVVFMIPSCLHNLAKARALRERLIDRGAVAYVAIGEPDLSAPRWHADGVVAVAAADTYEALPHKVLAAIDAIVRRHGSVAIFKLDDDCDIGARFSPAAFAQLATGVDYAGVPVGDPTHDRCWHIGKTADAALLPYGKRFHGPWARGGAYLLGTRAVDLIHREWALFPGEFATELYEDKMLGDFLRGAGVTLTTLRTEDLGVSVDMRERLADEPAATPDTVPTSPASSMAWRTSEEFLASMPGPIAVIGNGAPLRNFGAVIDRYPSVIRLNNYRLEGFERLVGTKTSARCTSAWRDIERRDDAALEFSPFTEDSTESANVSAYRAAGSTLLCAANDVHLALPNHERPSTGLALVTLLAALGKTADLFGFDGFASGHYWQPGRSLETSHAHDEVQAMLAMPGVTLYGESYPYAQLYDFCHAEHEGYNYNEGLAIYQRMNGALRGERIIEFGAGNGQLSAHLEQQGNAVTAVEVSDVAFARIPIASKIKGDCLTLPLLDGDAFDRFVSMDVLEHLTENDIRIVVREAARLARSLLVTVSTRPSGLLGPNGENLHLTVRPVEWWLAQFAPYFDVTATRGNDMGQAILEGKRRDAGARAIPPSMADSGRPADDFGLPAGYTARPVAQYYVDSAEGDRGVTWQPDVYPLAAELARSLDCRTIVDIGCGHARKLAALHPEFDTVGVDFGENIAHCRTAQRFGHWLESDLESGALLPIPAHVLAGAVVVCSDVIEHTVDPRPLLATLRELLTHAPVAVISTPDRLRTHGPTHLGPPPNPAHTREWELGEFDGLLRREGFVIASLTHTRSNDRDNQPATILAVVVNPRHPSVAGTKFGAEHADRQTQPAAKSSGQAAARSRVMAHVD